MVFYKIFYTILYQYITIVIEIALNVNEAFNKLLIYLSFYRLWNSTLLELFPKVDSVQIVSRAKIHIPPELSLQQNRSDDEFDVSYLYYLYS